jgi:hypothetical protein
VWLLTHHAQTGRSDLIQWARKDRHKDAPRTPFDAAAFAEAAKKDIKPTL